MENILILDFGGQYNQLIARRIREANVYCEVMACSTSIDRIKKFDPQGIILTGGPAAIGSETAPKCDPEVFELGVPLLGICYGMQLMSHIAGGSVKAADNREYGKTEVSLDVNCPIFKGLPEKTTCLMSHTYYVDRVPDGFKIAASTKSCPAAAMYNEGKKFYGVQFHPETEHTVLGTKILQNFLFDVCGCSGVWEMSTYVDKTIESIKEKVGDGKVLCALSGGVDSSVAAVLVNKAVGNNLTCIFVDHGLMRKDEGDIIVEVFNKQFDMNLIRVNAQERFLGALKGVTDPERKRKIIGEEFIRVFEEEAKKIGKVDYLVQGTIYPDIIESGIGNSAVIKSHHNVGGLPDYVDFKEIIEPLKYLFKDEVRQVGRELEIPEDLVSRQPFPGPGLAVRCIGEITEDKLSILREADHIFRETLDEKGVGKELNQYFAIITGMRSVGVMGDERTYDYTIALRAVKTNDFMTADWAQIPWDVLELVSNRIVNEVKHVNRIVYDITGKPPATIEWE